MKFGQFIEGQVGSFTRSGINLAVSAVKEFGTVGSIQFIWKRSEILLIRETAGDNFGSNTFIENYSRKSRDRKSSAVPRFSGRVAQSRRRMATLEAYFKAEIGEG